MSGWEGGRSLADQTLTWGGEWLNSHHCFVSNTPGIFWPVKWIFNDICVRLSFSTLVCMLDTLVSRAAEQGGLGGL